MALHFIQLYLFSCIDSSFKLVDNCKMVKYVMFWIHSGLLRIEMPTIFCHKSTLAGSFWLLVFWTNYWLSVNGGQFIVPYYFYILTETRFLRLITLQWTF